MRRIAQIFLILSVLTCTISCAEKVITDFPAQGDEITVTLQTYPATKAGYSGTSVLPENFYMEISNPSFAGLMTRADANTNKYNFPTGQNLKWGVADIGQVSVRAITSPDGCYSSGTVTLTHDQSTSDKLRKNDLLGASTGNGIVINNNNISISFNHLMSKLQLAYTSTVDIAKIELINICMMGQYDFNTMSYGTYAVPTSANTITMYQDRESKTAEAIFFPYTPNASPMLRIHFDDTGNNYKDCTISLRHGARFEGGETYMMNISVNRTSITIEGIGNMQVPGERVLWVGTSIPSGDKALGYTSYPEAVDMAMNCSVVNNAVGSSMVTKALNTSQITENNWLYDFYEQPWYGPVVIKQLGGLSHSHDEIEAKYRPALETVFNRVDQSIRPNWVNDVLNDIKALSYESLIIPYIDGTKDNCTTVILDHGYNDLSSMMYLANNFAKPGDRVRGYQRIMELLYGDAPASSRLDAYEQLFPQNEIGASYVHCMKDIIEAIRNINPNIRIIIGNYFTFNSPKLVADYKKKNEAQGTQGEYWDFETVTNLICYYNEAVAAICDVDIVNVYKYFWISDDYFWAGYDANGNPIHDDSKFCIDGTHPWNPDAVKAIAEVYINELDGIIGSRN